jgi:hypothetical protein
VDSSIAPASRHRLLPQAILPPLISRRVRLLRVCGRAGHVRLGVVEAKKRLTRAMASASALSAVGQDSQPPLLEQAPHATAATAAVPRARGRQKKAAVAHGRRAAGGGRRSVEPMMPSSAAELAQQIALAAEGGTLHNSPPARSASALA